MLYLFFFVCTSFTIQVGGGSARRVGGPVSGGPGLAVLASGHAVVRRLVRIRVGGGGALGLGVLQLVSPLHMGDRIRAEPHRIDHADALVDTATVGAVVCDIWKF